MNTSSSVSVRVPTQPGPPTHHPGVVLASRPARNWSRRPWTFHSRSLTETPPTPGNNRTTVLGQDIARKVVYLLPLAPGSPLLVQPGVDVAAPVPREPANSDERRPGPLLSPPFQRPQADLQLIGELLLGQEFVAHLPSRWVAAGFCLTAAGPSRLGGL